MAITWIAYCSFLFFSTFLSWMYCIPLHLHTLKKKKIYVPSNSYTFSFFPLKWLLGSHIRVALERTIRAGIYDRHWKQKPKVIDTYKTDNALFISINKKIVGRTFCSTNTIIQDQPMSLSLTLKHYCISCDGTAWIVDYWMHLIKLSHFFVSFHSWSIHWKILWTEYSRTDHILHWNLGFDNHHR